MWGITFWAPLVALSCPSVHVEQLDSHLTDFDDFLYCGAGSGSVNKNISKKLKFGQHRTIIKAQTYIHVRLLWLVMLLSLPSIIIGDNKSNR